MSIHQHIEKNYSIICANIRLAQYVKHQYSQKQLGKGLKSWETPDILTWNAWVRRCWSDLRVRHKGLELLLNQTQEVLLWQEIIRQRVDASFQWHIPSVAGQAQSAWRIMQEHRIPEFADSQELGRDHRIFQSWSQVFKERCQKNNWIDVSRIPERIGNDYINDLELVNPGIVMMGFDVMTPQQKELIGHLNKTGIKVIEFEETEGQDASMQIAQCMDISEEIRFAAEWSKQKIQENSKAKIGILAPGLRDQRQRIANTFEQVLCPGNLGYENENAPLPFSITLGRSLSDYPMIAVIFSLLDLKPHALGLTEISKMLRSPFIRGYEEERASRALLDEKLRSKNQQSHKLSEIKYHVAQMGKSGDSPKMFVRSLAKLVEYQQALPARNAPSDWSEHFANMLEKIGWPGDRQLNSDEQQQSEAWGSVLENLASIHVIKSRVSRTEALSILRHEASEQGFQRHTPESPIEVMDPQGAAAIRFDHVWMLGMNENAWPRPIVPNPFIPIRLQAQYGVMHSDTQLFLDWTERLQQKIIRSSPNVVFSYSRYEGDRPLLRSPLLSNLHGSHIENTLPETTSFQTVIFESRHMEEISDCKAPSAENHTGGTTIFIDQSQCPFRSFAKHRLHSRELEEPDIGLNPMQRGLIMHDLMQQFWQDVKNYSQLIKRKPEEHAELITSIVDQKIQKAQERLPSVFTPQFSKVEADRLKSVMTSWIEVEKEREPFQVRDLEFQVEQSLEGINFRGRIDRVDELDDGSLVIIDYKTGIQKIYDWIPETLREPQMPLYAVTMPGNIAVVVLAILKQGDEFGYRGLAARQGVFNSDSSNNGPVKNFENDPAIREKFLPCDELDYWSWDDLLEQWRAQVELLAIEFRDGHAPVKPTNDYACQYCDQGPFCRIGEIRKNREES